MTKTSFKQLLRTPWKTLLFFLLMAACALLLVFSSCLFSETSRRIDEVENSFTTLARVEQDPVRMDVPTLWNNLCWGQQRMETDVWESRVSVGTLNFDGADYVTAPEFRPYYITEQPDWERTVRADRYRDQWVHIFEFTALENSDESGAANVRVERVLLKQHNLAEDMGVHPPREGEIVFFCQCGGTYHCPEGSITPLKQGKRYIAAVELNSNCNYHEVPNDITGTYQGLPWTTNLEYTVQKAPHSTQCDVDGEEIKSDYFPYLGNGTQDIYRVEEVTEDFYAAGGRGQDWLCWAKTLNQYGKYFPVMPLSSLQMLPVFQEQRAYLAAGREITPEKYETGAFVCLVSADTMRNNNWQLGDRLSLPLLCSIYGQNSKMATIPPAGERTDTYYSVNYGFSPIKADGSDYEPFWSAEYEIVGAYAVLQGHNAYAEGELYPDTVFIPKNSVDASDEDNIAFYGYMDGKTATFQIKNGTIAEFGAALREHVPEMDSLTVTYNDNGYTDIMASLTSTRTTALLLFAVGVAAGIAVVVLLLYFFVVRQKKRTAIEQSLGMTKSQCRTSILAGLLLLTLLACIVGGALGGVLIGKADLAAPGELTNIISEADEPDEMENETAGVTLFNTKYSMWAGGEDQQDFTAEATAPAWLFAAGPAVLWLLVLVLAAVLTNRNLKIDPILLLGGKEE